MAGTVFGASKRVIGPLMKMLKPCFSGVGHFLFLGDNGGSFQNLTIGERAAAHLYSTFLHWRSVWRSLPLLSRTYIDRIGESDSKLFQHKYVPQILKAGSVGRSYLVKKYRVGWCTLMDVCNYIKWMNGGCFEFWGHDELKLLTFMRGKTGGPPLLKSVIKEDILF